MSALSPSSPTGGAASGLSSTALEAKIASIRAKNAALEKRHQEVQQDRLSAEQHRSSVSAQDQREQQMYSEPFANPFSRGGEGGGRPPGRPQRRSQDRAEGELGPASQPRAAVHTRLGEKDGPPPDPSYRFLADRMRDGENEGEEGDDSRGRGRGGFRPGARGGGRGGRGRGAGSGRGDPRDGRRPRFEESRPARAEGYRSQEWPEVETGEDQRRTEAARPPRGGGVPGRLERARSHGHPPRPGPWHAGDQGTSVDPAVGTPWQCPDPSCGRHNAPGQECCGQCGLKWTLAEDHIARAHKGLNNGANRRGDPRHQPGEAKFTPHPEDHGMSPRRPSNTVSTGPVPGQDSAAGKTTIPTQWHKAQPYEPKGSMAPMNQWGAESANWRTPAPLADWNEAVSSNPMMIPPQGAGGVGPLDWNAQPQPGMPPHHVGFVGLPNDPQSQFMPMPYQDPTTGPGVMANPQMMMHQPYSAEPNYIPLPQHHQLPHHQQHGALLAHTPIMATHPIVIPGNGPPRHQQQQQYYPASNGYQPQGGYAGRRPYRGHRFDGPRRGGNGEVTYIPQRFQKQRPTEGSKQSCNIYEAIAKLPRSPSDTAPEGCDRLLMFVSLPLAENLRSDDIAQELGVPIKLVPIENFHDLLQKVDQYDHHRDKYVLFHILNNDAKTIAQSGKSDVDKGQDSDNLADNFCDLVENLSRRVAYTSVFVSSLNPRFDLEEQPSMSCPNSVRKVINVQLSIRLHEKKNIAIINNDVVLEWYKDEVKKTRLFKSSGDELTAFGVSVMVEVWMKSLKEVVEMSPAFMSEKSPQQVVDEKTEELAHLPEKMVAEIENATVKEPVSPFGTKSVEVPTPESGAKASVTDTTESGSAPWATHNPDTKPSDIEKDKVDGGVGQLAKTLATTDLEAKSPSADIQPKKPAKAASKAKEDEFQEAENGGFIEDAYCDSVKAAADESTLPSLGSVTGDDDAGEDGPPSGIFIEDSYVEATSAHLEEEIREKANEEKMEKEIQEPANLDK